MQIDLAALPNDPAVLQQMLRDVVAAGHRQQAALQASVQEHEAENEKLRLLIQRLLRHQFAAGPSNSMSTSCNLGLRTWSKPLPRARRRRTRRRNRTNSASSAALSGPGATTARYRRICRATR